MVQRGQTRTIQKKLFWGGVVVLALLSLGFAGLIAWYWWQIASGQAAPPEKAAGGFTTLSTSQGPAQVSRTTLETWDDPSLGSRSAPITIVEFVDFKCPNSRVEAPIIKQVLQHFGTKVRLISRDFPIESLRAGSIELSELAHCAARQNGFWQLQDVLFARQGDLPVPLTPASVEELAGAAGLNSQELESCRGEASVKAEVERDYIDGLSAGVRGTPTFFVNGRRLEGAAPYAVWEKLLNSLTK